MTTQLHLNRAVDMLGSQRKLADAIGCSQPYINQVIKGKKQLSLNLAIKVEQATNNRVSRKELLPHVFDFAESATA